MPTMTWNKLRKVSLCSLMALLLCPAIAEAQTAAEDTTILPRVGIDFNSPRSGDDERSYGRVTGFIPLWQTSGSGLTFIDTAARINSTGDLGGTVTLGQRYLKGGLILGGHLSYDVRDTGSNTFHQLGLGVEAYGDQWDIHLNGYLPVGDTQQSAGSTSGDGQISGTQFQGNQLVFATVGGTEFIESAWGGVDLDAGMQLTDWDDWGELWGYGGIYYHGDAIGGRLRLDHRVEDWIRLGLGVQSDDNFGTRGFFSIGFSWGGGSSRSDSESSLWARAAENVTRNSSIVVKESEIVTVGGIEVAINPTTGQAYNFLHVTPDAAAAGDGTIENPAANVTLVNAQTGDIVYVTAGDSQTNPLAAFTVPAGVQVVSNAISQTVITQQGVIQLPGSGTGVFPLVNAAGTDNGVTLIGGNNRLSGFTITGAVEAGVFTSDAVNVTIDNNQIADSIGLGIRSENITNATIENNTISNISGGAIGVLEIDNLVIRNNQIINIETDTVLASPAAIVVGNISGSADISNNTVSNTTGSQLLNGLGIAVANATGDLELNIANNTVSQNEGEGVAVLLASDGATVINATDNIVENNNGQGIFVVGNAGNLDLNVQNNTIRDNQNDGVGVLLAGDVVATIAISDNIIERNGTTPPLLQGDGIKIAAEESSAVVQLEITNNLLDGNLDDGIDISLGQFQNIPLPALPLPIPGFGAAIGTSNAVIDNATISNNTIINTQNGQGIALRSLGDDSNLAISVNDNTLSNNAGAGLEALSLDANDNSTTRLCLALTGNDSDSDYLLVEAPNSTFTVVDLNLIDSSNTGTVLFQPAEVAFDTVADIASCPD